MGDALAILAAVVSAIGTAFAAAAASRSAGAARASAKHATDLEHRTLVRDVLEAAASITRDAARAKSIADALPGRYKALQGIAGSGGGSNERDAIAKVGTKAAAIEASAQRARDVGNDYTKLYKASADDLSNTLAALIADQVSARALLDDLMTDQSTVAADTARAAEHAAEFAARHAPRGP